jgi:hypothetical protein
LTSHRAAPGRAAPGRAGPPSGSPASAGPAGPASTTYSYAAPPRDSRHRKSSPPPQPPPPVPAAVDQAAARASSASQAAMKAAGRPYIVCLLTFSGGHRTQTGKFSIPTVSEDGETQESQDDMLECSARDWEDYNYAPLARVLGGGIHWLIFVTACLDLKLQKLLHFCVIFRYQHRATWQCSRNDS